MLMLMSSISNSTVEVDYKIEVGLQFKDLKKKKKTLCVERRLGPLLFFNKLRVI